MASVFGVELSYDKLRALPKGPRLHPNGFIQLDLTDTVRLHVWPDKSVELPKPKVLTVIHDHTFDFVSTVVVGQLTNLIYEFEESPSGPWHLYSVKPYAVVKHWVPMMLLDNRRYASLVVDASIIHRGESYEFQAFKFHETLWDAFTVTAVKISNPHPNLYARVACDVRETPDNEFRRDDADPKILWNLIKKACTLAAQP